MKTLIESVVETLDGFDNRLYPHLPYLLQDLWGMGSDPEAMSRLLKGHGASAATRVLDLGCGKGAVAVRLAEEIGCRVRGVDAMPAFIASARAKAKEHGVDGLCAFEVGDLRDRGWAPERFDAIVFGALGLILGDMKETLGFLRPSLAERGVVLLDDGYLEDDSPTVYDRCLRKSAFFGQIAAAGFEVAGLEMMSTEAIRATDRRFTDLIAGRAEELIRRHPRKADLFRGYVESQERETSVLDNDIVCGTWLLGVRSYDGEQ